MCPSNNMIMEGMQATSCTRSSHPQSLTMAVAASTSCRLPPGLPPPPGIAVDAADVDCTKKRRVTRGRRTGAHTRGRPCEGTIQAHPAPPGYAVPLPKMALRGQAGDSASTVGQRLLIAYFPREATKETLTKVLHGFGAVTRVHVVCDFAGVSRCFAFVELERPACAQALVDACAAGKVVMTDSHGKIWHVQANRAESGPRFPV